MPRPFNRVGLVGHFADPRVAEPTHVIRKLMARAEVAVIAATDGGGEDVFPDLDRTGADELAASVDLMIAIGGDGTMLHAAHHAAAAQIPIVGVNRGRLGFLTDVTPEQLETSLAAILDGDYVVDTRLVLDAEIRSSSGTIATMPAINDVVLQKSETGHMLDFVTWVDGHYVNSHAGDGLIVSSATGSTAYALSCGGPIIQPDLDVLALIPICPHTLSDRPLLVKSTSILEARVDRRQKGKALVTCDGVLLGSMAPEDVLIVKQAPHRVTFLHPVGYDYYEILRSKLHWGQSSRAKSSPLVESGDG